MPARRNVRNKPSIVRLMPVMDYGGVETIVAVLAERLPRAEFDFRVCTFWDDGEAAARVRAAGIACDVLGTSPALRNIKAPLRLAAYLAKHSPDVLHASISEANFHSCVVARAFPRMSLLLEEVGTPLRSAKARRAFGLAYRRADGIIGVSQATARYLVEEENAPADRVHQIYNCVDDRFFRPLPDRPPVDGRPFRVGIVGRLVVEKNHRTLLDAWEQAVQRTSRDLELHIVGDGPLRAELEARVSRLSAPDSVVMHGFRTDVTEFVDTLDAVVLPSIREGYGIALVEAMARGLPVIGSTSGGIPEVLEGYPDEWSLKAENADAWADALLRLAETPKAARDALGARARELAHARFSSEAYIEQMTELYQSLVPRPRR